MRAALAQDMPIVGICRGHQLLNIALGGTLYQDLEHDGVGQLSHVDSSHDIATADETLTRRVLGRSTEIVSQHHQGVRRLGRGLRPSSASPDGVIESIESRDHRFAVGFQWHPELPETEASGRRVAEALTSAALRPAA